MPLIKIICLSLTTAYISIKLDLLLDLNIIYISIYKKAIGLVVFSFFIAITLLFFEKDIFNGIIWSAICFFEISKYSQLNDKNND